MKIGIISDIHANLEAFSRVLEDLDRQQPDRVFCCGDSIGYGPEPEAVVRLLRNRGIPQVLGNHELGCMDRSELAWFNPVARKATRKTREMLSRQTLDWFNTLPCSMSPWEPGLNACHFVHGAPPDSARTYLFEVEDDELHTLFEHTGERVVFVGHTHELVLASVHGTRGERREIGEGVYELDPDARHIVNVGSVGQPRDGDNRAKYVLFDPVRRSLEVRCIPYDIKTTADAILALGFPEQYARRLW